MAGEKTGRGAERKKADSKELKLSELAIALIVILGAMAIIISVFPEQAEAGAIPKFESCSAMTSAFRETASYWGTRMETGGIMPVMSTTTAAGAGDKAASYSTTNVQVEGVDEADIVKTDGKYIYLISNGRLVIADAYPAGDAEIVSSTELGVNADEIFIGERHVLVFGRVWKEWDAESGEGRAGTVSEIIYPDYWGIDLAVVQLWDVDDKAEPKLVKTAEFEGQYLTSRKIGKDVYFVVRSWPDYWIMEDENSDIPVPLYRENSAKEIEKGKEKEFSEVARCIEIGYFEPIQASSFITVASMKIDEPEAEVKKETVVGMGENVYASLDSLYVAEVNYAPMIKALKDGEPEVEESEEKTVVHKFGLKDGKAVYIGFMEAPGYVLNQFSMDEHNGYFRIATTRQGWWSSRKKTNNVYVFDSGLKEVGALEGLAEGETIHSARFMGDKAYVVTFKKTDPLFVIDLSVPSEPKVLGQLKIPGYSDYLHPIDETHLIGLGKEAAEADEGDFAWYQGLKLAVFDVSDVSKPKQMYNITIGDRGTDSYALYDHKAFLYDKEKNLLVIPVLLAEIDEEKYPEGVDKFTYGDYVFQGAYVYDLTLENGFNLKGRITHLDSDEGFLKAGYYYGGEDSVKRALYIDDVLYTISDAKILANALGDLSLVKELKLTEN